MTAQVLFIGSHRGFQEHESGCMGGPEVQPKFKGALLRAEMLEWPVYQYNSKTDLQSADVTESFRCCVRALHTLQTFTCAVTQYVYADRKCLEDTKYNWCSIYHGGRRVAQFTHYSDDTGSRAFKHFCDWPRSMATREEVCRWNATAWREFFVWAIEDTLNQASAKAATRAEEANRVARHAAILAKDIKPFLVL